MSIIKDIFLLFEKKIENLFTELELKKVKTKLAFSNLLKGIVFSIVIGILGLFILVNLSNASTSYFTELFGKPYYGYLTTTFIFLLLTITVVFYRNSITKN
jgi:hypothetical protein